MQKLQSLLLRTQSLQVLPLKPGVGQYMAIHATLTAVDFFLANFNLSGSFICIIPNLSRVFPVLAVTNTGSRVECPRNINRFQNMCFCFVFCVCVFVFCFFFGGGSKIMDTV